MLLLLLLCCVFSSVFFILVDIHTYESVLVEKELCVVCDKLVLIKRDIIEYIVLRSFKEHFLCRLNGTCNCALLTLNTLKLVLVESL